MLATTRLARSEPAGQRGASLLDALVAIAIVTTVSAGVAQLIIWSRRATWSASTKTIAVVLAEEKMERLRGLVWEMDTAGISISDEMTDLSVEPAGTSGRGLQPSPAGTLLANTAGYVDYADADGQWCGTGITPCRSAAFVRRWAVEPVPSDATDTLVLTVAVFPLADAGASRPVLERGVRLKTIRTRAVR